MKALFATVLLVLISGAAQAASSDYGLSCIMAYSSTSVLEVGANTESIMLSGGPTLRPGSAVATDSYTAPANYIKAEKKGAFWTVTIFNSKKSPIGAFSFLEKQGAGMKATLAVEAQMANESEDPSQYNKLEVSCHYTFFAG